LVLPVKKSRTTFSQIEVPYALKLLDQELTTYANTSLRFLTEKHVRTFRDLPSGTGVFETTPATPPTDILSTVVSAITGTAAAAPAEESVPTPSLTPVATTTPAVSKEQAAADAMYDFMPGGPPKLEVIEEVEEVPTPAEIPEETPSAAPVAEPDTTEVKIVKVDAPTPEMAGPAEPVPTVISEAKENPLIDETDTSSVAAVKDEPTPPAPIEPKPRRSSMKGGRAAEAAESVTESKPAPVEEADIKVIKIDA